jgi:hypothetical protein
MSTAFNAINGISVASNLLIDSNGNLVGGTTTDLLSTRLNSENLMTTSGTASLSTWNRVKSLGGNVTITIPSAAANDGKFIGIIADNSCGNYLVTLQDAAGAYLDYKYLASSIGVTSRVLWANEAVLLYSNGVYWHKIAGKIIPMTAILSVNAFEMAATNYIEPYLGFLTGSFTTSVVWYDSVDNKQLYFSYFRLTEINPW